MITEDYVSYETAKLLKEKGFDEYCTHVYNIETGRNLEADFYTSRYVYNSWLDKNEPRLMVAPTLQMAIKWLNEVHHILVVSDYEYECTDTSWYYKIYKFVDEHGKCKSWPVNAVRDIDGLETEVTVAFRDYMRSYKDYATRKEADEEGIRYVLENLI